MAKKIKVIIEQGVKIDGKYPAIGSEVDIEGNEAKRLLELGAVSLPKAKLEVVHASPAPPVDPKGGKKSAAPDKDEAALIEKIRAAQSQDELIALVADDEKRQAVVEAATAKMEELIAAAQK